MNAPSHDRGDELPPVMRRGVRRALGLSVSFAAAAIAWVALRGPHGLPRGGVFRFAPLALSLMPFVLVLPLWWWRTRWIRRALFASDGRLCTHCAYNLSAMPDAGVCPECGHAYNLEVEHPDSDRRLWENVGARYGEATRQ